MSTNHTDRNLLSRQVRLRDLCDEIAKHDGIETRRVSMTFNDGVDCEYEYLDGSDIFAVELLRDHGATVETYDITVKRNLRDDDGHPTREWEIISTSSMSEWVSAS